MKFSAFEGGSLQNKQYNYVSQYIEQKYTSLPKLDPNFNH